MTTEVELPPLAAGPDDIPIFPHRPAPPDRGVGRWLRLIAGIKEDILDWVPEERPRYARLGAIILNTGCLAALSLLAALDKFFDAPWVVLLPVAAFWGWVVLSIDGWLVSSTHGMLSSARFRVFIPRMVLAVLIGVVIAEPLLLRVFQPAIHQEVLDHRSLELVKYESLLRTCNPVTGIPVDPRQCKDFRLNIKGSPEAAQQKLQEAIDERDRKKKLVDQIQAELQAKDDLARAECNGARGTGLSGILGEGPNCKRDRAEADAYRKDSKLAEHQAQLAALDKQVLQLTADRGNATQTYGQQVNAAITAKVNERRSHQGKIGLLDEDEALGRLSSRSGLVLAAQLLVRLLLIAIDCLPVLTKLMGGTTTYDRLVARQLVVDEDLHDTESRLSKRRDTADKEVELQQIEQEVRRRIEKIAEADRVSRLQEEAELDAEIDALAARLRGQTGSP